MKRKNAGFAGLGRNVFAESSQIRKDRQASKLDTPAVLFREPERAVWLWPTVFPVDKQVTHSSWTSRDGERQPWKGIVFLERKPAIRTSVQWRFLKTAWVKSDRFSFPAGELKSCREA